MNKRCRNNSESPLIAKGKKHITLRPLDTPGVICVESHILDEDISITGTLTVAFNKEDLEAWIIEGLKVAAGEVKQLGGHAVKIQATLMLTTAKAITIKDESNAEVKPRQQYARITISSRTRSIAPKEAEGIVRNALVAVRTRLKRSEPTK